MQGQQPAMADQHRQQSPQDSGSGTGRHRPEQRQCRHHQQRACGCRGKASKDTTEQAPEEQRLGADIAHGQRKWATAS